MSLTFLEEPQVYSLEPLEVPEDNLYDSLDVDLDEPFGEITLAAEVLQVGGILDQETGPYLFPVEDVSSDAWSGSKPQNQGAGGSFELARDDMLHLIGLLNSPEIDVAKRELGTLLGKLDRSAVEGLTHRLFSALRRRNDFSGDEDPDPPPRRTSRRSGGQRRKTREHRPPILPSPRFSVRPPTQELDDDRLGELPSSSASVERLPITPRMQDSGKRDELPPVFRRLTASMGVTAEEVTRARSSLTPTSSRRSLCRTTPGDVSSMSQVSSRHGESTRTPRAAVAQQRSQLEYLEQLLEAHDSVEDVGSRRTATPRVSEEKAREIFDRLYASGKEQRIRRRVYLELGQMVNQAKDSKNCTFKPRTLARSTSPRDALAQEGAATDRLYFDGLERIRRREEMVRGAPTPTFRPQTTPLPEFVRNPRGSSFEGEEALGSQGDSVTDADVAQDSISGDETPSARLRGRDTGSHIRLFTEGAERRARQHFREEMGAEWKKHTFRPDITTSQMSGPQITRASSSGEFPLSDREEEEQYEQDLSERSHEALPENVFQSEVASFDESEPSMAISEWHDQSPGSLVCCTTAATEQSVEQEEYEEDAEISSPGPHDEFSVADAVSEAEASVAVSAGCSARSVQPKETFVPMETITPAEFFVAPPVVRNVSIPPFMATNHTPRSSVDHLVSLTPRTPRTPRTLPPPQVRPKFSASQSTGRIVSPAPRADSRRHSPAVCLTPSMPLRSCSSGSGTVTISAVGSVNSVTAGPPRLLRRGSGTWSSPALPQVRPPVAPSPPAGVPVVSCVSGSTSLARNASVIFPVQSRVSSGASSPRMQTRTKASGASTPRFVPTRTQPVSPRFAEPSSSPRSPCSPSHTRWTMPRSPHVNGGPLGRSAGSAAVVRALISGTGTRPWPPN